MDVSATLAAAKIAGKQSTCVVIDKGSVFIRSEVVSAPPPQAALLQLLVGGICNTDLELQRGYYDFQGTPGHEFVARVVSADDAALVGKRVVGEINIACGHCDFCRQNLRRHCRQRSVLGIREHPGAFATYFHLPEINLHIVPDNISDEQAVFTEPLAAACEILDQVAFEPNTEVAVLGDGKLGLLVAQVLLAACLRVTLYGRHAAKLTLARKAGAVCRESVNLPAALYSYVVDCTGSADGLAIAIHMARPRGTVVMKSTIQTPVRLDMAPAIVNEVTLVGSRCGSFEPALRLLEARQVEVDSMISAEFPLSRAVEAFEQARTPGTLKVLLRGEET